MYADEARLLQRHFNGTSVKIGIGENRAATAATFLHKHALTYSLDITFSKNQYQKDLFLIKLDSQFLMMECRYSNW